MKWPLWKYLMFVCFPLSCWFAIKIWSTPWWLLSIAPYFVLILAVGAKGIHEDNIEKAQNPEYVTATQFAAPFILYFVIRNLHLWIACAMIIMYLVFFKA